MTTFSQNCPSRRFLIVFDISDTRFSTTFAGTFGMSWDKIGFSLAKVVKILAISFFLKSMRLSVTFSGLVGASFLVVVGWLGVGFMNCAKTFWVSEPRGIASCFLTVGTHRNLMSESIFCCWSDDLEIQTRCGSYRDLVSWMSLTIEQQRAFGHSLETFEGNI